MQESNLRKRLDGDGLADSAVFKPSTGIWTVLMSGSNYATSLTITWGASTDIPIR